MKKISKTLIAIVILLATLLTCFACNGEIGSIVSQQGTDTAVSTITYSVTTAPTETESGVITSTEGDVVTLPALNTDDYYYSVVQAATCQTEGLASYLWKESAYGTFSFDVTLSADESAHTYSITETVAATQTTEGHRTYVCSQCGDTYSKTLEYNAYDESKPTTIYFANESVVVENDNGGVEVEGTQVTIVLAGEYSLSGNAAEGSVKVNVGEEDKVTLNLEGLILTSSTSEVIYVENADKVEISAKKDSVNVLTDTREAAANEDAEGGAVVSECDLELKGKGSLTVISSYNNGIHGKDDLDIKNLTLYVKAVNNALKGNDSLTITSGCITAISTGGDALKTSNSGLTGKGKQKGTITISGGTVNAYAACDGIDAAYDVVITQESESTPTVVNVYTDKYSEYSGEVTAVSENTMYIRNTTSSYYYSVYFYDSQGNGQWANASYYTTVSGGGNRPNGRSTYYYYKLSLPSGYNGMKVYVYTSAAKQGTEEAYASASMTRNTAYDTLALNGTSYVGWTNYTTVQSGFGGGFNEGNKDKGSYSTKGIKADNEVNISAGTINVTSYDDGIHASTGILETSTTGAGKVSISGGSVTVASNDDAIHADGTVSISGGSVNVTKAYEGVEGVHVEISGGSIKIVASDDGVNASGTSPSVTISGGYLDITMGSGDVDGIDSNGSFTMTGGVVVTRGAPNSTNGMASGLDCDGTVRMSGGTFVQFGSIETRPSLTGCYTLSFGASAGGMGRYGGSSGSSYAFTAGTWTIEGLGLSVTNTAAYYGCTVYSASLTKGASYTITNGSTSYTATAS